MRSTSNRRAIIVGIFIFLGLVIFIITVLTLGSQKQTFEKAITIRSVFDDVNGLQKGNNIWFSGVKIGTVRKIAILGNAKVEADLNIDEKAKPFIKKDSKAKISSDGFIGNKIVVIYGGSQQSPPIEAGDLLGIEKLLSTDEMMSTLAKNNDNLLEITNGFKVITKSIQDGKGTLGKLLTDDALINELSATTANLKRTSANFQQLSTNVAGFTSKLKNKGTLASDMVTDTIVFSRLRSTVDKLQQVAEASQGIVDNLKTTTNNINNGLNNNNAPVGMLLHDEQSAANLKAILQNLQSGTKKLDDDLEAVQHNFLLRGFFKKKAKNEKLDSLQNKK
jgi:phospholipid/cholesterol/gamma-HCH transport system substrate-binding protein